MEILDAIFSYVLPIGGGITVGGAIIAIGAKVIKSGVSKLIDKINVKQIEQEAVQRGIDKIKDISFTQSIQPVVESELKKVTETANEYLFKQLKEVKEGYANLVTILAKFSAYFDNSVGIPENVKKELKDALAGATPVEEIKQEITVSAPEEPEEEPEEETPEISIER